MPKGGPDTYQRFLSGPPLTSKDVEFCEPTIKTGVGPT